MLFNFEVLILWHEIPSLGVSTGRCDSSNRTGEKSLLTRLKISLVNGSYKVLCVSDIQLLFVFIDHIVIHCFSKDIDIGGCKFPCADVALEQEI